ncbi:hypothetical protein PMAC_001251 [Pneumocystis sp. 'macacae']|nr:hypothetical protein PMAC_001251 [Pneumocystis sp. 'macacae']
MVLQSAAACMQRRDALPPRLQLRAAELRRAYREAGQAHVWAAFDRLPPNRQRAFVEHAASVDPAQSLRALARALRMDARRCPGNTAPLPRTCCASTLSASHEDFARWTAIGLEHICHSRVAAVVMAAGDGTRLRTGHPKGCHDIGLPSHKSLFQLQAERIRRIETLAQTQCCSTSPVSVPWYIMTNRRTRAATEDFFRRHAFFGLQPKNVVFFVQHDMPCMSEDGKIIMEARDRMALAPGGNGGVFCAMATEGVLEDMAQRGIEHVHCFSVDNSMVRVADPIFIGFSVERGAHVCTKVVRKRGAGEKVGLVVERGGRAAVVEYSEIGEEIRDAVDAAGELRFGAANIANHYFSMGFLVGAAEWERRLPYHVARKKMRCCVMKEQPCVPSEYVHTGVPFMHVRRGAHPGVPYDPGEPGEPGEREQEEEIEERVGVKLEKFVFDAFSEVELEKFGCLEVARFDEFSAVKNAEGEDSADTSRRDILSQGRRWVEQAGGRVEGDMYGGVEVSPLVSYAGEDLEFVQGRCYEAFSVIEADGKTGGRRQRLPGQPMEMQG